MADPKPIEPGNDTEPEADDTEAARIRGAIGEGLRKFYEEAAEEPIPAEWLAMVGLKPDETS